MLLERSGELAWYYVPSGERRKFDGKWMWPLAETAGRLGEDLRDLNDRFVLTVSGQGALDRKSRWSAYAGSQFNLNGRYFIDRNLWGYILYPLGAPNQVLPGFRADRGVLSKKP